MPPVDLEGLLAEDERHRGKDLPYRVGHPMKADISPDRTGSWEILSDGSRVWRQQIVSRDALWIVLGFGTFRLQPGGALYVYDQNGSHVLGPFTAADVRAHGQLWLPPIEGESLIVELHWPASLGEQLPNIHLGTVSHGYKPWGDIGGTSKLEGETDAGSCNIDVNCPLGDAWQDEKRGVVNLLSGGSGYCSGSLIATAEKDCRNFVLTANHCVSGASTAASTVFQFNFERPQCNAGTPPTDQTVSGSVVRATYGASDFTLLEMDTEPPEAFAVFYNGWTRSTGAGTESWAIHHPSNDEKKISFNEDPLVNGQNYGPDHWRVTEWEQGTTERGSSGSPLFDQDHRIVGQLHGGTASCTSITWDEYGKLDVSWTGGGTAATRLSDWLDPDGSGIVVQDGIDAATCRVPQPRLSYAGSAVDDGAGNADGIVDPGETFVLEVDLENAGTLGATAVSGSLSSTTVGVTITDPGADWPDIPEASTRRSLAPHFTVALASEHPCGEPLAFHLDTFAAEDPGSWASDFELPTGTANVDEQFRDEMEAGVNGWTEQTLSGSNAWLQTTADSFSPSHSWFVEDISTVSDAVLVMPALPALAERSRLLFRHRINAENNYDGGVLEYSTDGASWLDAGALIVRGGYTSTISTSFSSPLGGREAWSGDSGGWQQVEADLSSLAGADLELRWRFATDSSVSDEGWYIDDVVVESTSYSCNGPLAVPGEVSDPSGPGAPLTVSPHPDGFELAWSVPVTGGSADRYSLYRTDLSAPLDPVCETGLGSGTSAVVATLPDDHGLLIAAHNAAGQGPLGKGSDGTARRDPQGTNACP
ncbi:MAG: trypsin-like peptidase domain-containing protein [Acidobacteriota bacterium]|nr:MAG: trypsin-like peptidase domain-containing protein [Acidobacteriota bacterium]